MNHGYIIALSCASGHTPLAQPMKDFVPSSSLLPLKITPCIDKKYFKRLTHMFYTVKYDRWLVSCIEITEKQNVYRSPYVSGLRAGKSDRRIKTWTRTRCVSETITFVLLTGRLPIVRKFFVYLLCVKNGLPLS